MYRKRDTHGASTQVAKQSDFDTKIGIFRCRKNNSADFTTIYENTTHDLYPQDKLKLLADLYKIEITKLLDDYNLFLYNGQGKQIKALRNRIGLTIPEFARLYNTIPNAARK